MRFRTFVRSNVSSSVLTAEESLHCGMTSFVRGFSLTKSNVSYSGSASMKDQHEVDVFRHEIPSLSRSNGMQEDCMRRLSVDWRSTDARCGSAEDVDVDVDVRGRRAPADSVIEDVNGGPGDERCDAFCGVLVTMGLGTSTR